MLAFVTCAVTSYPTGSPVTVPKRSTTATSRSVRSLPRRSSAWVGPIKDRDPRTYLPLDNKVQFCYRIMKEFFIILT